MSLIYEPRGKAREYAPLALNVYRGCQHNCSYCYAPSATFRKREDFATKVGVKTTFSLATLEKEAAKLNSKHQRILLSFTTDPYQPLDVEMQMTRKSLEILKANGHRVQILTKGGSRALRDIDLLDKSDAFATTLTFPNWKDKALNSEWSYWEPGAAHPQDRIETLKTFYAAGIPTWVSLEPVLNPDAALEIIKQTHGFVDLFKVGKLNYHKLAKTIDWREFYYNVTSLLISLGKDFYIKDDLKAFA